VPVLIVLGWQVAKRLRPLWVATQSETGALGTVMQESLSGRRVVMSFVREDFEIAKYETKNREVRDLTLAAMRLSAWNQPLMVLALNIVTILVPGPWSAVFIMSISASVWVCRLPSFSTPPAELRPVPGDYLAYACCLRGDVCLRCWIPVGDRG
jgi:ABC-type multidrug transport system fused ATPase/permease subunit